MKKLIIALLIAIFILSISVPAFAYPSTDHFISSGKVNDVWWFKGFGYLYGDDEHWYDLAIELWDSSYTYVLAQGSYTA